MRATYREVPRGYASALIPFGILAVGYGIDAAFGGASTHLWGWLIAVVVVVGLYVLIVYAARSTRTLVLDAAELRVGSEAIPREMIVGVQSEFDDSLTVLGMPLTNELPKGAPGLAVVLNDGTAIVVPTRFPDRFAMALGMAEEVPAVRPAEDDDLALLDDIGDRSDALFRVAGYELPAHPMSEDDLADAKAIFVVGRPAFAFVMVGEADGNAHIDELGVVPAKMRQGIGSSLVEAACEWAGAHGYEAVTLTTFRDIAWNGPFYERLGFAIVDDTTPEVAARRERERARGLDSVGTRVAMRRELRNDKRA